jgi:hypothetical protein
MTNTTPDDEGGTQDEQEHGRRHDGLFVTDAELIRRIGVPEKIARQAIKMLDAKRANGWQLKQALWGSRRYWPPVVRWLDETLIARAPTRGIR